MKYCECGKKNDFTAKFCSNCGHSFINLSDLNLTKKQTSASSQVDPPPKKPSPAKQPTQFRTPSFLKKGTPSDDDEDDDAEVEVDMDLVNNITGLEVEITPAKPQTSTIGGLMETGSEKSAKRLNNSSKSSPKINKKKILDEIKKEGSSIRNG